jgi:hypothetical protein
MCHVIMDLVFYIQQNGIISDGKTHVCTDAQMDEQK